jgi:hypothetical protein
MDDEDKRRTTVLATHEWIASTALAPHQYKEFIVDLFDRGKISLEESLELLHACTKRQPPNNPAC